MMNSTNQFRWSYSALAALTMLVSSCGREYARLPRAVALVVEPSAVTINPGENQTLSATLVDENGNVLVSDATFTWRSASAAIASVTAAGRVTGVAPGTTEIVVTGGGLQGASVVTVRIPAPARVTVDPPVVTLARGDSATLSASALAADGTRYTGRQFTWNNANPTTVTLTPSADGSTARLVAVAPGSAALTATNLGVSGATSIVVLPDPVISFSEATVSFAAQVGGSDPASRSVRVTNAGGGALRNVLVRRVVFPGGQGPWLTAAVVGATSSTPGEIMLTPTIRNLTAGPYTATVVVGSTQPAVDDQSVNVTLSVTPPPVLTLGATTLSFSGVAGGNTPPVQSIDVTNTGGGTLSGLTVSTPVTNGVPATWLTVSLTGTTAPAQIRVGASATGLMPGSYTASFTVSAPNALSSPRTVTVTFAVGTNAAIQLSQSSVTIAAALGGGAESRTVNVSNGGGGALTGLSLSTTTYGTGQPTGWLLAQLSSSQAPASITITAPQGNLTSGTYTASFQVLSSLAGVAPVTVTVSLTVAAVAVIGATPSPVTLVLQFGANTPPVNVSIVNTGGGTLGGLTTTIAYAAGQPTGWLTASFAGLVTTAPTTLVLQAQVGSLNVGSYAATVTITSPNAPVARVVPVTLSIPGAIFVPSTAVTLTGTQGLTSNIPGTINVASSSTRPISGLTRTITYATAGANWLTATLSQNTTPATLNISAAATGTLPRGTDVATVRLTGDNVAPQDITITRRLAYGFAQHITPRLTAFNCTSCHGSASVVQYSWNTTNFSGINGLRFLTAGGTNEGASQLYLWLTGGSHSGPTWSGSDQVLLRDYIRDGTRP